MNYTTKEATTISEAYRHLCLMIDDSDLPRYLDEAFDAATSMGSRSRPACIHERQAGVINAFLQGFKAPKKTTAADMHGCSRWWQVALMAGARFRTHEHPALVRRAQAQEPPNRYAIACLRHAAKARRMMRDAVEAHITARDRYIDSL